MVAVFGNNFYIYFFMKKTFRLRPWRSLLGEQSSRTSSGFSLIIVSLFVIFTGARTVFAAEAGGLSKTAGEAGLSTGGSVQGIIGNVIGAGLTFVGVLFLVLMIYGGITWMTARGNEQQSKKALDTIMAAVIGLIIVLGSYAFTNFVFTSVENTPSVSASCEDVAPYPSSCGSNVCIGILQANCVLPCCEWR